MYDEGSKHLYVVDYKNGFDPVPPDDPQLVIYGIATRETHNLVVNKVTLVVVQPNGGGKPVKEHHMSEAQLTIFRHKVSDVATTYRHNPIQPTKAGPWCKWCRAKPICSSYHKQSDDVDVKADVHALTDADLLDANEKIPSIKAWIKQVGQESYKRLMAGSPPNAIGAMLNRSSPNRVYKALVDDVKLEDAARAEFGDQGFSKPAPLSPAQIEKLPGGKAFAMQWAYTPAGNLVLAGLDSKKAHVMPKTVKDRLTDLANS